MNDLIPLAGTIPRVINLGAGRFGATRPARRVDLLPRRRGCLRPWPAEARYRGKQVPGQVGGAECVSPPRV